MKKWLSFLLMSSTGFAAEVHQVIVDRFVPNKSIIYVSNLDGSDEKPLLPADQTGDLAYNATYSADGQWIAFGSEKDGSAELYRVRADGTKLERLTENPAYDDQPSFSPDGRQIVFVSTREGGHANLWVIDVASRKAKRLTKQDAGDFRPSWSPDGRWIAFASDRDTPYQTAKGRWEAEQLMNIYLVQPNGSGLRKVTNSDGACGSPKWSHDSKKLLAYCETGQETFDNRPGFPSGTTRLVTIDVESGMMTDVAAGPGPKMAAGFVGNTDQIGYVRKDLKSPGIFYTDGKTGPKGLVRAATWSPDGTHILYHKFMGAERINGKKVWSRESDFQVRTASEIPAFNAKGDQYIVSKNYGGFWGMYIVDPESGKEKLLYDSKETSAMGGAFSSDGAVISFALGNFFAQREKGAQLFTIKADGTGMQQITNDANNNSYGSISPDGKQIVYRTMGPLGPGIRLMNLADKSVKVLSKEYDNFPLWSPKGDKILLTRKAGVGFEVFTMKPDGTDVKQLTFTKGNDGHAVWSSDGSYILFPSTRMGFKDECIYLDAQQPQGELFVMRADGSQQRQITDNQWEDGTPAWRPETSHAH